MHKRFYITTTLPYVNAPLHIGHALEFIRADAVARYKKASGYEVFFNTGTDEHGQKILESATKEGKLPQDYVDSYFPSFKETVGAFGVDLEILHFIRTTDAHHESAAQEFWRRVNQNGYIYKKNYKAKYCVGCEEVKTESELVNGCCPIHPNRELEIREEENYFFKFSAFGGKLLSLYESGKFRVIPETRFNEMKEFITRGLEDFSISRLKTKMPWGVAVPDDSDHVMYVWFDALTNYISTLGWPEDGEMFEKFWVNGTPVQYCGKDNTRFQSITWQAMLLAAGLPSTQAVVVNGFIISGGVKMSKSIGNVINPLDVIESFKSVTDFPEDVLRFILLHDIPSFEDGDLTMESIKQSYMSHLANGLGNLTSRIMKMSTSYGVIIDAGYQPEKVAALDHNFDAYDLSLAMKNIISLASVIDEQIATHQPFKKIKIDEEAAKNDVLNLLKGLLQIACELEPFLPRTSKEIQKLIRENKMPEKPLFARLP